MNTLTVKDLARTEQLDRAALSAVRGGTKMSSPHYSFGNTSYAPSYDSSVHATQNLMQMQNVVNATANGSAFIDGVNANNTTSLFGQNNIVAGS
ncbi:MAG: hypothetical protein JWR65_1861 [Massilia sp.]|nr:hypothetical protein [Massilia sp.]